MHETPALELLDLDLEADGVVGSRSIQPYGNNREQIVKILAVFLIVAYFHLDLLTGADGSPYAEDGGLIQLLVKCLGSPTGTVSSRRLEEATVAAKDLAAIVAS